MTCKACGKAERHHLLASVRAKCPEYNGEAIAQEAYSKADLEARADKIEGWARDKMLPEDLRKSMMAVAWDMKVLARGSSI